MREAHPYYMNVHCSEEISAESEHSDKTVPWRGQGTVLLIDDDYFVRLVTTTSLRSFGLKVEAASDGRAGLATWGKPLRMSSIWSYLTYLCPV